MSLAAVVTVNLYQRHISQGFRTGSAAAPTETVSASAGYKDDTHLSVVGTWTDTDDPITLYVVALSDGATAPSEAQIAAGTDASDVAAPNGSESVSSGASVEVTVAGLSASTAYDLYYTASDIFANYTTAAKIDDTTDAAPTFDPQAMPRGVASTGSMVRPITDDMI